MPNMRVAEREDRMPNRDSGYETIAPIRDDAQEATIAASYTPNNGIRIEIINDDLSPDWAVFDMTDEDAEKIGAALVRWAAARRASA